MFIVNSKERYLCSIYNMQGNIVYSKKNSNQGDRLIIDCTGLPKGVYIINGNRDSATKKIILN
jgi:hypothetical protein